MEREQTINEIINNFDMIRSVRNWFSENEEKYDYSDIIAQLNSMEDSKLLAFHGKVLEISLNMFTSLERNTQKHKVLKLHAIETQEHEQELTQMMSSMNIF